MRAELAWKEKETSQEKPKKQIGLWRGVGEMEAAEKGVENARVEQTGWLALACSGGQLHHIGSP